MIISSKNEFFRQPQSGSPLRFTPREWRLLLEDPAFLNDQDNRYLTPRRFMGADVEIVPDHQFG